MNVPMLRRMAATAGLAGLLMLGGAAPALGAAPPGWTSTNISNSPALEQLIGFDDYHVAWTSRTLGETTRDILVYSASGLTRTAVADATISDATLAGRWLAYVVGTGNGAEIWVWDGAAEDHPRRRCTTNGVVDSAPAVSGNILVWVRNEGPAAEIYWIDLTSGGTEQRVTNNFVEDSQPVVSGDWIAWLQRDPAGAHTEDVFVQLYNRRTGLRVLVTPESDPVCSLCLHDGLVAFATQPGCVSPARDPFQVMTYSCFSGNLRAITDSPHSSAIVAVHWGRVAYITREPTRNALHLYDIGSGITDELVSGLNAVSVSVGPEWVVWQATDGLTSEVFVYHIATKAVGQLTDNGVDDLYPLVSTDEGDAAVWIRSIDLTHNDVWLAHFELPFVDVPANHDHHDAIENLFILEIMSGYDPTHFGINDSLLRQQFAKMIVLTTGVSCTEADRCRFSDVTVAGPSTLYPDNYVEAAAREGLTTGKTAALFAPYDSISRAQVMTMIVRAAQRFVGGGLREPPADWRGELSEFSDPTHGRNAHLAEYNGLLSRIDLEGWDVWGNSTRGEVAQMLWNLLELIQGDLGA